MKSLKLALSCISEIPCSSLARTVSIFRSTVASVVKSRSSVPDSVKNVARYWYLADGNSQTWLATASKRVISASAPRTASSHICSLLKEAPGIIVACAGGGLSITLPA